MCYDPFSLKKRDFLGFWMIFKVPLNQMFSIEFNLYLMVHSIVLQFEKIWLSHDFKYHSET
jgi:hypothetical protein